MLGGSKVVLQHLRSIKPKTRPELVKAFTAAGESTAQLLIVPTADNRRVLEEVMPTLPKEIGGGLSTIITHGIQWAAIGVDVSPKITIQLVIQSQDAAAAKALRGFVGKFFDALGQQKMGPESTVGQILKNFDKIKELLTPVLKEDRLTLTLNENNGGMSNLTLALVPLIQKVHEAANKRTCANNLKQILLAHHGYHDANGHFLPSGVYTKDGKPGLSWRVHLLPFLEQGTLYKEFHLDEPWDSAHNKKLINRIPAVYRCPDSKLVDPGKTTYVGVVGESTVFTGGPKGIHIRDITDGTSNTIFIVDANDEHAVIWTKPDELKLDDNLLPALVGHHVRGFFAAFADGSVHFISEKIDPKKLRALLTRNGGELVKDY